MITKQKGTNDIYGEAAKKRAYVNEILATLCEKYNYGYIETPVFEASELFHRGVGETTDMVQKETYDFKDRGDRDLTLRPEGTAPVVRWFIENKLYGNMTDPVKVFYNMKMYRYERPQSGRMRELTQWGFECFGSDEVISDAEVISLAYNAYRLLGLDDVVVELNTLGDTESRSNYREALVEYFKPHIKDLCEDCQERFEKNPLRILDCKVDAGNDILKHAPKTIDYLNEESKARFEKLKDLLELMDINYVVNTNLVRGLDYYNHTVFEISLNGSYALGGGGRYNGLVETLDGPSTPAVGFAMGLDRTIMAMEENGVNIPINDSIDLYILYVSDTEQETAAYLTQDLRLNGFIVETDSMKKSLKAQFKSVDRFNSKYLIVLNEEELKTNKVTIKDNKTKEEEQVSLNDIADYLDMHM
ncbi:MAG: histidine--tRNA ligase [Erysipelotrichales bacterium]|nr:histidine--tRNA ligase [Erysipelotrichales bacterium]